MNWNNTYVSSLDKSFLYGSLVFFVLGSIFLTFSHMLGIVSSFIFGITFILLAFLYKKKYDKEFQQNFIKYHGLDNQNHKDIDYIFYDVFSYLRNDIGFIKNKNYLFEMANIEINREKFLNSTIVILIMSAIISIGAGIFVGNAALATTIKTIIYLIALIFVYNLIYTKNQHYGRNKHASFKLFLLKIDYFNKRQSLTN